MNIKQMEIEVRQFVDDQIGLDAANYSIYDNGFMVRVASKKYIVETSESMKEEWKDAAAALIAFLEQNAFGKYELFSVSPNHCEVMKVDDL